MAGAFPLYILSGGQSARFGSNKALAELRGKPLIAQVAEQFQRFASRTVVIANDPVPYFSLGVPIIPDIYPGLGPISGLHAACGHMHGDGYFWLAGCDTLLRDPGELAALAVHAEGAAKAIAYKGEFWEPLPALYHGSILRVVESQIEEGERALWRVIEKVAHKVLEAHGGVIAHINTRQDLERFAAELPADEPGT
ncbi:MAG TPA: molybdenum cofactor guanylyltransferase [Phycisphaerae bacterium]|jgi:molybdopterin-guanine dinucleotide biosynthesis protein A|nr:molybdenum cofactor guanylyltransferase [Phycisphaerae bacterium]